MMIRQRAPNCIILKTVLRDKRLGNHPKYQLWRHIFTNDDLTEIAQWFGTQFWLRAPPNFPEIRKVILNEQTIKVWNIKILLFSIKDQESPLLPGSLQTVLLSDWLLFVIEYQGIRRDQEKKICNIRLTRKKKLSYRTGFLNVWRSLPISFLAFLCFFVSLLTSRCFIMTWKFAHAKTGTHLWCKWFKHKSVCHVR